MKLLMLAKSSLKKNRSSAITLLFLIITATLFLYIGLHVLTNLGSFLDKKHESLNGADFVTFTPEVYNDYIISVLSDMEELETLEQEKAIVYHTATIQNKKVQEKAQSIGIILMNSDTARDIQQMKVIDAAGTMTEDSIIVPYSLKSVLGYQVGDQIEITFQDKADTFIVYGFCEDVFFSTTSNISFYKCFVSDDGFQKLNNNADEVSQYSCIKTILKEGTSSGDFEGEYIKQASLNQEYESATVINLNYEAMKIGTGMTINIIMMILVFFAALVIIISMVVIRYTVITHIEEDIKNIGSMEAIGFTNHMIQNSLILEFLVITIFGFLIGILISLICSGAVTNVISSSIGLNWHMEPGILSMLLSFTLITLMILLITIKVTRRIAKITPLMALRNGIDTYHFGKNYFPLEKSLGYLHLLLGFKQIFNNKKQSISIGIIGTLMSFTIVFSIAMYHNFVQDEMAFLRLVGMERADLAVVCYDENYEKVYDMAADATGVAKSIHYTNEHLTVQYGENETSTNSFICDDYDKVAVSTVIEGRYPKHDNEIVISTVNQRKLGAEIGDVVSIKSNDKSYDFMVVGITQHINSLGQSISITEEGMLRCNSTYIPVSLYLYLNEGANVKDTIAILEDSLADYSIDIVNMEDIFNTTLSSITQSISMISITICVITAFIVVLILYYLVKVKILRERNLIGINKALGFTTGQLILHNNVALGTIILFSTLLGSALAVLTINPLCILMLSVAGIRNGNFIIPPSLIGVSLIVMELLTLITTTLVSVRIRKVNPRELMAD
jgi:putative ABC transport system permease protein